MDLFDGGGRRSTSRAIRHNWNELHCAARDGNVETVKRILHEALCDINDTTPINETAIHKAVRGNSVDICKILILHGANPNIKNKGGRTPLYFVLSPEVAGVLLEAGAETSTTDKLEKKTPLEYIKERHATENIPELEEVIKLIESWTNDKTPLEIKYHGYETILAYREALKNGTKPLRHIRFMLVGPERAGKTSLKNSLLGYKFNNEEKKTDGIDSSNIVRIDVDNVSNWEKDPGYNLSQILAKKTVDILRNKSTSATSPVPSLSATKISQSISSMSLPSSSATTDKDVFSPHLPKDDIDSDNEGHDSIPKDIDQLVNRYMKQGEGDHEEKSELIFSVWDFAGHHMFYSMHQAFLSPRSIYCVVFNASKDLHAKADMDFLFASTNQCINQDFIDHEITNLEFLNFWLSSIFSHVPANAQTDDDDNTLSPPVFIVGTHIDLIEGTDDEKQQKIEKISATIKGYLQDKAYKRHVVPEIYFVNNKLRPISRNMRNFKEHVEKLMRNQPYMNDEIPISWFKFQCHVMKHCKSARNEDLSSNYMTLEQAKEVAMSNGVQTDQQLFTMLQLFHDVGIIAFYGKSKKHEKFEPIVVLKPQWLSDVFTKVITTNKQEKKWPQFKQCWKNLEEKGILEETLIEHVWSEFNSDQREYFLQIMERFDLLCEKKIKRDESYASTSDSCDSKFQREFFVPCQLIPNQEDNGKIWENDVNAVVLNIVPNDGFFPEGLFNRLTVRASVWTQQKPGCQLKSPRLFYRQTELYLDEDHELFLKMHVTKRGGRMVKVVIYFPPIGDDKCLPTPSVCKQVLDFIENHLNDLKMMWMKNIKFGLFVPCYMCQKYDDHYHDLYNSCLKNKKIECGRLRDYTKFWRHLFGSESETEVFRHPLITLKERECQTKGVSLAPLPAYRTDLTSLTSSESADGVSLSDKPSTSGLITELSSDEAANLTAPGIHNKPILNVFGDNNMLFVNSSVNIVSNTREKRKLVDTGTEKRIKLIKIDKID